MKHSAAAAQSCQRNELDADALLELGNYLRCRNYRFITVTPVTHDIHRRRTGLAESLRDIFGWNMPFEPELIESGLFEVLARAKVVVPCGDVWRSTVRCSTVADLLLIHSAYPTQEADAVFLGPDTYRFVRFLENFLDGGREIHRAVDIGSGTGAAAIVIASRCPTAQVLAVDINPLALQFCQVNTRLASLANVETRLSDIMADVDGDFDLIVANPPYLLDAGMRTYRHGGGNLGEALSQRIVEEALVRLQPGGSLLLYTGVAIVDGRDVFREQIEEQLRGRSCHWRYEEIDPDVFSEELHGAAYAQVERIAVVGLTLRVPQ